MSPRPSMPKFRAASPFSRRSIGNITVQQETSNVYVWVTAHDDLFLHVLDHYSWNLWSGENNLVLSYASVCMSHNECIGELWLNFWLAVSITREKIWGAGQFQPPKTKQETSHLIGASNPLATVTITSVPNTWTEKQVKESISMAPIVLYCAYMNAQ